MPEVDQYIEYTYILGGASECMEKTKLYTERIRGGIGNRKISIDGKIYQMPHNERYYTETQMYNYKIAIYKGKVVAILRAVTPTQLDYLGDPDITEMMGFQEVAIL
ncbi:hypothetical protein H7170_01880 [Candidatus Gracilibacteria bacterium]|nr:hypothetical protein [Candidatus Gracilibacteria bacterium]